MGDYGLNVKHLKLSNNKLGVELIEKKKNGIFSLLNEEMLQPKGSDQTWLR